MTHFNHHERELLNVNQKRKIPTKIIKICTGTIIAMQNL
jgi:hypothetical protein